MLHEHWMLSNKNSWNFSCSIFSIFFLNSKRELNYQRNWMWLKNSWNSLCVSFFIVHTAISHIAMPWWQPIGKYDYVMTIVGRIRLIASSLPLFLSIFSHFNWQWTSFSILNVDFFRFKKKKHVANKQKCEQVRAHIFMWNHNIKVSKNKPHMYKLVYK